jgi:hypothetical protein
MRLKKTLLWIPIISFVLGLIGFSSFAIPRAAQAQDGGGGDRTKTIDIETTQYVWELLSRATGQVLCEVTIEHKGVPTDIEVATACGPKISAGYTPTPNKPAGGPLQPTTSPWDVKSFLQNTYWRLHATNTIKRQVTVKLPKIIVYIEVPDGAVPNPYAVITAYDPVTEYYISEINGTINGNEFVCSGAKCQVPINQDSILEFWATSSSGDESEHVQAQLRVIFSGNMYYVTISFITPAITFTDACAASWGTQPQLTSTWALFPSSPEQINTAKKLYYLASRLIVTGVVNAETCPNYGLFSLDSPDSCGMEKARDIMIKWQNQYDPAIWIASKDAGIPPRVLKTLIEIESQFWPANAQYFLLEYGLAQINELGADVVLRWDTNVYQEVCKSMQYDCSVPYISLPSWQQAIMRGGLMQTINAECSTCVNGADSLKAQQSINIIAQTLRANCWQTKYIVDLTKSTVRYEDAWRFTMVSYHSGYQCLLDAINTTKKAQQTIDWKHVSANLNCPGAQTYVDKYWEALVSFDNNLLAKTGPTPVYGAPTFVPTRTPAPSATPVISTGSIRVLAYIDQNANGIAEDNERIDGITALATFNDGSSIGKTITHGEAIFDPSGRIAGTDVTISLPSLYRSFTVSIPIQGEQLVEFRLEQAPLPTASP